MRTFSEVLRTLLLANAATATTRTLRPASCAPTLSVWRVAPLIGVHDEEPQTCHWYETPLGLALQRAGFIRNVPPGRAEPTIAGAESARVDPAPPPPPVGCGAAGQSVLGSSLSATP